MAKSQLTIEVQLENSFLKMKNSNDSASRKRLKIDEDEGKYFKTPKLNRFPTKTLKRTDLLLPADLRAILIGAPRSGLFNCFLTQGKK